ncbi:uncharacterized protein [Montipora capricornis]|uniref:uncharacterized protein isoform X2 n=1 Tax=Montipora capricornis TaxID=246305 RepID=UPI0035F18C03
MSRLFGTREIALGSKMQGVLMKRGAESVEVLQEKPPWENDIDVKDPQLLGSVRKSSSTPFWVWIALVLSVLVFVAGLVCIILAVSSGSSSCSRSSSSGNPKTDVCSFSEEAKRGKLPEFLKKVQTDYYALNPNKVSFQPDIQYRTEHVKNRYFPYNPDPTQLKRKTDRALELFREIKSVQFDENKMKPREVKSLAQVKHFLQHTFGVPYAENYYAGDWLLGPDLFCWQPICSLSYEINAYAHYVKPKTYDDVQKLTDVIRKHKRPIDRYRENVELGVKSGMVRTVIDCQAGVDALKESYRQLSLAGNSEGILREWFAKGYLNPLYLLHLDDGVDVEWRKQHHGKSVNMSIQEALKEGVGQPLLDLINYLDIEHKSHCLPNDLASGLSNLPVDYVYINGTPDKNQPTNKTLPTGETLNGTESYKMILSYFTTTDISPEEILAEGERQLKFFYDEVIDIAKRYTSKTNESEAIQAFRKILNSTTMWHNNGSFPKNESDSNAFKKCVSPETAAKYCPVRWEAVNRWAHFCEQVMGMLYPKITNIFYFTGPKITAPNCPIQMLPHYNPSNGAQFFQPSDAACSQPAYFGLPFFLKDFGPIFQEWSVTGHESRPGHHTQVQGHVEHFADKCGGVPAWLDESTYYTAFTEGWGLYSENPVLSDDTDTYKDNLLQKYGMAKWQTWRAVRLIVDTGLHSRGLSRTQALKMFEQYAWDTSDFAIKEVTRYQSDPGQATAYMLGRLALIQLRNKTEAALGKKFSLQDFHYQVLSQGSAPLSFLQSHIDRYIKCATGVLDKDECTYILQPMKTVKTAKAKTPVREMPPTPARRHYI